MITADFTQCLTELNLLIQRASNPQPFLNKVGEWQKARIETRIDTTKQTPDGAMWAAWQPRTLKERTEKQNTHQGLLWDTGALLHSIQSISFMQNQISIGTDIAYAEELQDGRPEMPPMAARPFVGWESQDLPLIEQSLAFYLETGGL